MERVLFCFSLIGFFIFGIFGADATWNSWHLHHTAAWDTESDIYWLLMTICGFSALVLSKSAEPRRRNHYR